MYRSELNQDTHDTFLHSLRLIGVSRPTVPIEWQRILRSLSGSDEFCRSPGGQVCYSSTWSDSETCSPYR